MSNQSRIIIGIGVLVLFLAVGLVTYNFVAKERGKEDLPKAKQEQARKYLKAEFESKPEPITAEIFIR